MRKLVASLGVAFGAMLCAMPATAGIVVKLAPSTVNVATGAGFSVDVLISGLAAGELVSGFDMSLTWAGANVLTAGNTCAEDQTTVGADFLGSVCTPAANSVNLFFGSGLTDVALLALQEGVTGVGGEFRIATFDFTAGATPGGTDLVFDLAGVHEITGGLNDIGLPMIYADTSITWQGACVDVGNSGHCGGQPPTGVPEPASFGLAAVALLGAGAATRRRRTVRSA